MFSLPNDADANAMFAAMLAHEMLAALRAKGVFTDADVQAILTAVADTPVENSPRALMGAKAIARRALRAV